MRGALRRIGTVVFFVVVALVFAPVVVPPFLDRIYYLGPETDHFDGRRFFNPETGGRVVERPFSAGRMLRFLARSDRAVWPTKVPVQVVRPPERVAGRAMRVTWVGHATVLVQTQGLNILTDPIWSDVASPFPPFGPRRVRAPAVPLADLPPIDLVLVSHNHYDHFDLPSLRALWKRDHPTIVTSLGNDRIMADNGIAAVARDWGGRVSVRPGIDVVVDRVHHWGSRWGSDRNRALWSGFTVTLPGGNLFFAGDTGFGDGTWADAAAARGPIRLAILPIGAFLPRAMMQDNHVEPAEAVTLFERLGASYGLAMHWGTFQLSNEAIDAPPRDLGRALDRRGIARTRFRAPAPGTAWMVP